MSNKKKINRSGIVPYYVVEGDIKMLFMKPSDPKFGGDCFQIAKGKQEPGEDLETTALREGQEELGLFEGNIETIHRIGKFLGYTEMYVARIKDPDFFGDPHFETSATRWMEPSEFLSEGRDLHKPVVKAMVRLIEKKEGLQ